jgi:Zn-finger nucleic acid-binding protein
MICPTCREPSLKEKLVKEETLALDYCPRCKGIWFDRHELDQVIAAAAKDLAVPSAAVRLKSSCPKCEKPLYAFPYPRTHFVIQMCKKCKGLWLTPEALRRIQSIRERLQESGDLADSADVGGVKGELIAFIDSAIKRLLS